MYFNVLLFTKNEQEAVEQLNKTRVWIDERIERNVAFLDEFKRENIDMIHEFIDMIFQDYQENKYRISKLLLNLNKRGKHE